MPKRFLPNSNPTRLKALNALADRVSVTLAKLAVQQPAYNEQSNVVASAKQAQTELSAQVTNAHTLAGYFVRDFVQALFGAIRRGTFNNSVKAYYKIDLSSNVLPDVASDENLNMWAKNLADGEAARIAAGGDPITFPAIAEVNAATDNFKAWNEVETFYNEGDLPNMRNKAREWGVIYLNDDGTITENVEIAIDALLDVVHFAAGDLKPTTVVKITNHSLTANGRGFLCEDAGQQQGDFQESLATTTTNWIISNFGGVLGTCRVLNVRNLSSTEVLKLTIEYKP